MEQINDIIARNLREQEAKERAAHEPSGKLSASQLGKPLMEQVLKIIGVPEKPFDDYALRLFARGRQVEDWVVSMLPDGETQKEISYKDTIGFIDYLNESVYEIKSTKRSQLKWLRTQGAKSSHKLQACLYALAEEKDDFHVVYICADDFEVLDFKYPTESTKDEVDGIIDQVHAQLELGELPDFTPREEWQSKIEYASKYSFYPDWVVLTKDEANRKLFTSYPEAFKKLQSYKKTNKEIKK